MNLLEVKIIDTKSCEVFKDEQRDFFSEVWNSVAFTLGIRKHLVDAELNIIYKFLVDYYKTVTLNDIREAFGLYSAQRLDYKTSHFQSLDNVFIGAVLSSYQRYKAQQNLIKPLEQNVAKALPKPKITKEENALHWFEWIEAEVKKGKIPLIADWSAIYWHMEKTGLINLDDDAKEMFIDNVRQDIKDMILKLKAERKDYSIWSKKLIDLKSMKLECRKRMVINYYENL